MITSTNLESVLLGQKSIDQRPRAGSIRRGDTNLLDRATIELELAARQHDVDVDALCRDAIVAARQTDGVRFGRRRKRIGRNDEPRPTERELRIDPRRVQHSPHSARASAAPATSNLD